MSTDLIPIASFVTAAQAAAAKVALEAEGISCFLKDANVVSMDLGNAVGYVKLLVAANDAERANELLRTPFDDWPSFAPSQAPQCRQCGEDLASGDEKCRHCGAPRRPDVLQAAGSMEAGDFRQRLLSDPEEARRHAENPYASPRSQIDEVDVEKIDDDAAFDETAGRRARCPDCNRLRVAVCPYCKTTGSRFRAADVIGGQMADAEPILLVCPICDEPFEPTYLRRCEWCGHDFGDGMEPPAIVKNPPVEPPNARVLIVGLAGVAIVAGLFVYFAFLL
jgi:hypothetical protein